MTEPQPQPQPQPMPQPQSQPQPMPQPQMQMPEAFQSIIEQQNTQIAALIAQNQALNGQITQMVQGGAQFMQQTQPQPQPYQQIQQPIAQPQQFPNYYDPANPMQRFNPSALSDDRDWSLESLAKEIGKPAKE